MPASVDLDDIVTADQHPGRQAASKKPSVLERLRAAPSLGKLGRALVAGIGGFATIFCLSFLTQVSGTLLLIAPFGASCVLVFALPKSPLAQPRNVVGGHLVSSLVGLVVFAMFGASPLAFGIGVGIAIAAMLLTDTIHPPAGADPIVVILAGASWPFLFTPVLVGAAVIVSVGWVFHRYVTGSPYPNQS